MLSLKVCNAIIEAVITTLNSSAKCAGTRAWKLRHLLDCQISLNYQICAVTDCGTD